MTFTIVAEPPLLNCDISAFYHTNFYGVMHPENPNYLYKLKNDPQHNWSVDQLRTAMSDLKRVLMTDLPEIQTFSEKSPFTICVVPRAKTDNTYRPNQLLFKSTIKEVVKELGFMDGTNYIVRQTNTRTTHLRLPIPGYNNDGAFPYRGITIDTCTISNDVKGKDIILIDDIYTRGVNIDEDAIQALLDGEAKSVVFYAVGNTIQRI